MITKNFNNIAENLSQDLWRKTKQGLNFALDYVRPFFKSLGLRIAKLRSTQIEIIIPTKPKNWKSNGRIHEGVLLSTMIEAIEILWHRNRPEGNFNLQIQKAQIEFYKTLNSDIRFRMEMTEIERESVFAELNKTQESEQELIGKFYNQDEILVAEGQLKIKLTSPLEIEWK
jgi:acyl-coenzyme A thioesterase PaaI-like protein